MMARPISRLRLSMIMNVWASSDHPITFSHGKIGVLAGSSPGRGLDEIASFGVALERGFGTQHLQLAHDLAAVAAARRAHQLLEGLGALGRRRRERCKAFAGETRRRRDTGLHASAAAE